MTSHLDASHILISLCALTKLNPVARENDESRLASVWSTRPSPIDRFQPRSNPLFVGAQAVPLLDLEKHPLSSIYGGIGGFSITSGIIKGSDLP